LHAGGLGLLQPFFGLSSIPACLWLREEMDVDKLGC
ncbi:Os04g0489900, partial [Oryza sativa Japonica Group]